jgi:hypothetical protein
MKQSVILKAPPLPKERERGEEEEEKKTFQHFWVISHLNNKFHELHLPNQDISNDKSLMLWKGHLSNSTCLSTH